MIFVAHGLDKENALDKRLSTIDAHREYLANAPNIHNVKVLMSGPLVSDDCETMKGSFFLLASRDRGSINALFEAYPMCKADVWQNLTITRVRVRQNNVGLLEDIT